MSEIQEIKPPKIGRIAHFKYSKDGTNYDVLALECPNGISCGYICITDPAILIIDGYDKTAYAFLLKSYISWDYVYEKLSRKDSQRDARNITELINHAKKAFKKRMS